jgi:hypothetical protein
LRQQSQSIAVDRPRRNIAPRKCLIEECNILHYVVSCAEQLANDSETITYTKIVAYVNLKNWISAMQEEIQFLQKNCAWGVVCFLSTRKLSVVSGYLKEKEGLSPKETTRFKARLVAKGFIQILGID